MTLFITTYTKVFLKQDYNRLIQEREKPKGIFVTKEKESISNRGMKKLVEEKLKKYEDDLIEISKKLENLETKIRHLEDRNLELRNLEQKKKSKRE